MRTLLHPCIFCFSMFSYLHAQPVITYDSTDINMGIGIYGYPKVIEIGFTNTGNEPLIITEVIRYAGGSDTDWPSEPIMPGQRGLIKYYRNNAALGPFQKCLTVISNAEKKNLYCDIRIKGEVVKSETPPADSIILK